VAAFEVQEIEIDPAGDEIGEVEKDVIPLPIVQVQGRIVFEIEMLEFK